MLEAIKFGYEHGCKPILEMQIELMEKAGKTEKREGELALPPADIMEHIKSVAGAEMEQAEAVSGSMINDQPASTA